MKEEERYLPYAGYPAAWRYFVPERCYSSMMHSIVGKTLGWGGLTSTTTTDPKRRDMMFALQRVRPVAEKHALKMTSLTNAQ